MTDPSAIYDIPEDSLAGRYNAFTQILTTIRELDKALTKLEHRLDTMETEARQIRHLLTRRNDD